MSKMLSSYSGFNNKDQSKRVFTRLISQVSIEVKGTNIYRQVQERILKWANPQIGGAVPDSAWAGESFEVEQVGAQPTSAVKIDDPKYWALQFNNADTEIAGRTWTAEVAIAEKRENHIVLGCRLLCSNRGGPAEVDRTIPAFIRKVIFVQDALLDGRPQGADPWFVYSQAQVDDLVAFLKSEHRQHPVVIFSLPEGSENPEETILNVQRYIRKTVGYVHSVVISCSASYLLSNAIGQHLSVYNQGVRTYLPGFSEESAMIDHPLATQRTISTWRADHDDSFMDFLVNQSLKVLKRREQLEREHPPFHEVKRIAKTIQREIYKENGATDASLLELAEEEIQLAKQEVDDVLGLLSVAEKERDDALIHVQDLKVDYFSVQARLQYQEKLLEKRSDIEIEIPNTLDNLETWCQNHLSGSVVVHQRAIKSAKISNFEDVAMIYKVLLILKEHYVPMRKIGGSEYVDKFETAISEWGLEHTKCFGQKNKAKQFDGEYFVTFQGESKELVWHLKGSSSRDGRLGFRLYFFWDDDTKQVVVGYMPGHLKTAQS